MISTLTTHSMLIRSMVFLHLLLVIILIVPTIFRLTGEPVFKLLRFIRNTLADVYFNSYTEHVFEDKVHFKTAKAEIYLHSKFLLTNPPSYNKVKRFLEHNPHAYETYLHNMNGPAIREQYEFMRGVSPYSINRFYVNGVYCEDAESYEISKQYYNFKLKLKQLMES